jgi:pSer/pThr/pTyr-binding forkhead associated (FHA) protein
MDGGISRVSTDAETCLPSHSDIPRALQGNAGRLVSLPHGKSHPIGSAPLTIGRGPSCDVPVHSEEVSRSHAHVMRTPEGVVLVDSSLHGTYINGERVQAQRLLIDGDIVQIGSRSFRFDLRSPEREPD